ncbi:hypothetical protein BCR34DRAFT_313135 [Clohesyomyces aquaticus]|uniref:Uncharacterized protein n=1 Tax=Clohesyomyces aquaticus TaxID=1231657 RepID=A0A1Y1ZNS7_9PLEO|nr:hypothetical protein BCR34DRAFT_313135 [Clohesyomyces aquaticus]
MGWMSGVVRDWAVDRGWLGIAERWKKDVGCGLMEEKEGLRAGTHLPYLLVLHQHPLRLHLNQSSVHAQSSAEASSSVSLTHSSIFFPCLLLETCISRPPTNSALCHSPTSLDAQPLSPPSPDPCMPNCNSNPDSIQKQSTKGLSHLSPFKAHHVGPSQLAAIPVHASRACRRPRGCREGLQR